MATGEELVSELCQALQGVEISPAAVFHILRRILDFLTSDSSPNDDSSREFLIQPGNIPDKQSPSWPSADCMEISNSRQRFLSSNLPALAYDLLTVSWDERESLLDGI